MIQYSLNYLVNIIRLKQQMTFAIIAIVYHVLTMINDVCGIVSALRESITGLSIFLVLSTMLIGGSLAVSFSPIIFLHMVNFLFALQVRTYLVHRVLNNYY